MMEKRFSQRSRYSSGSFETDLVHEIYNLELKLYKVRCAVSIFKQNVTRIVLFLGMKVHYLIVVP